jgi:ribonuclease VapC
MIVDASAVVAILQAEPEREMLLRAIARAPARRMSPVNWFEAAIVVERGGADARTAFEDLIARSQIQISPVESVHMMLARKAWQQYGKGRHRTGLNLGDCFAYALAKHMREPLLFKGGDFRLTDVTPAL